MKKLVLIGVLAAAVCLLALFSYFNYLKPKPQQEDNFPVSIISSEDAPVGYFDLRGQKEVLVDMKGFDFTPRRILVSPGTKVLWRNRDQVFHSVTFEARPDGVTSPTKNSGNLKVDAIFAQVLDLPGSYPYHSDENPDTMTGIILVK